MDTQKKSELRWTAVKHSASNGHEPSVIFGIFSARPVTQLAKGGIGTFCLFLADDHLAANQTGEAHQKNATWTAAKNNCPERDSHKGQTCGPIGKRKSRNLFFSALQVHLDPEILDLDDQQRFYRCLPVSRDLQTVKRCNMALQPLLPLMAA
jgi:hypothetical protein